MKKILVTGGVGYIGSHTVRALEKEGYEILIFDNLSSGHKDAIKGFNLLLGDLSSYEDINKAIKKFKPDAVVHFAGSIEAGESMTDPARFYQNNVINSLNLVNAMVENNVKKIVFSSSAAIYGEPKKTPIRENDTKKPTNVYGLTKLIFEEILHSYNYAYGLKSISLRYFNAAGADPSGDIGADHKNKTHLITLALLTALGQRDSIKIFGTDYNTKDGTCIRDYIHVNDLADAHILALKALEDGDNTTAYNLGNGIGHSVREVLETAKKITGIDFKVVDEPRREGDPAILYASSDKAMNELGWKPKFDSIEQIVETAWKWHKKNPNGFEK